MATHEGDSLPIQGGLRSVLRALANRGWARTNVGSGERLLFFVTLAVITYLVVPPLLYMIWTSLNPGGRFGVGGSFSFSAYQNVLTSGRFASLLGNTFIFTFGSTVLGIGCGGVMAWLVQRTNTPLKSLGYAATFIGFAVPGILRTIGWVLLLGPNGVVNRFLSQQLGPDSLQVNVVSLGGMVFIEALMWVPVAFMMLQGPFRAMDPALEEAGAVSGANSFQVVRRITAPLLLPGLLSVTLLMTMRVLQAFEVPMVIGIPAKVQVLTSEIYERIHRSASPDFAQASSYGTLLVIVLCAVLGLYYLATKEASRFQTVTGKGYRPRVMDLQGWRWAGALVLILVFLIQITPVFYLVLASLLPSLAVAGPIWENLTLANYANLANFPGVVQSIMNSMTIGLISASGAIILAMVAAWIVVRSRVASRWLLEIMLGFPLVYPGIIMGLAILVLYLRSPIPIYGTIWILVMAYLASFTPFAMRYVHPALLQIHRELEESAFVSGATPFVMFRRILVPLLVPALSSAWVFIFFIAVRELSVAVLLYTGKSQVVATQILDMWTNGSITQLAAFGSVVAIGSVLVGAFVFRVTRTMGVHV